MIVGKLLAGAAALARRKGEHAAGAPHLLHGVDVASFQGEPGAWRTEAGSIDFAAVKITELRAGNSRYVNPYAGADLAYLRQHGKARIGYLFAHPAAPAADTVAFFVSEVKRLGLDDDDGVAIDHEVSDSLAPAKVSAWAQEVARRLEDELDRTPWIYSDRGFVQSGYCAGLGHLPLWIADPSSPAGHPVVPGPWKTWTAHQYSWQPLDKDVARFESVAAMKDAIGKKGPEYVTIKSDGSKSLEQIGAEHDPRTSPARALFLTAHAGRSWQPELHDWLDEIFKGKRAATGTVPRGIKITLPKKKAR